MGLAARPGRGVPAVHDNAEKRDGWRFGDRRRLIAPNGHLGSRRRRPTPVGRGQGCCRGPRASSRLAEAVANARGFLVSWACITTTREEESPMRLTTRSPPAEFRSTAGSGKRRWFQVRPAAVDAAGGFRHDRSKRRAPVAGLPPSTCCHTRSGRPSPRAAPSHARRRG